MGTSKIIKQGPFATAGVILGTVSSAAQVLDQTVRTSGDVLHQGLTGINVSMAAGVTALEIVAQGALEDLRTDEIIESAHRTARIASAKAEAARIIAGITPVEPLAVAQEGN